LRVGLFHITLKFIHHQGDIKIISSQMALQMIENVGFNPTITNMTQVEVAISTMSLTELFRQTVPLQGLLGTNKPPAFMHVVLASECPVMQFHLQLMEFRRIQLQRPMVVELHNSPP